jgi:hypothetical protein
MRKLICSLLALIVISTTFSGCNFSNTPEHTINNALQALKAADFKTYATYTVEGKFMDSEDTMDPIENYGEMFHKLSYKLTKTKIAGNIASVNIELSTIDMSKILIEVIQESFRQTFANAGNESFHMNTYAKDLFHKKINAKKVEMKNFSAQVKLKKVNDKWLIISDEKKNEEYLNAVTGGFLEAADRINQGFSDEEGEDNNEFDENFKSDGEPAENQ